MSLAELDTGLFARKGQAAPTPFAGQAEASAAFGARRRLTLVAPVSETARPRPARRPDPRRRFTFRLDAERHTGLAAAADRAGMSRQRFLETVLDAALEAKR
jgi:hypothetical protein